MQQKLPSIILSTKYILQVQHKACYFNAFHSNVCYQFLFCLQLSIPCLIIKMFVHISYSGKFISKENSESDVINNESTRQTL